MKLGSLFGQQKTLASAPKKKPAAAAQGKPQGQPQGAASNIKNVLREPGAFNITWPKVKPQQPKNYKPIFTREGLIEYLKKCEQTGLGGFDYETAADKEHRRKLEELITNHERRMNNYDEAIEQMEAAGEEGEIKTLEKERAEDIDKFEAQKADLLMVPLDPWKADICTVSISAQPHESIVVPISQRDGRVFEPELSREEAREEVFKLLDRYFFTNKKIMKIAENLAFETKQTAKMGRYILEPVADPQVMRGRVMQIIAPQKLKNSKKPLTGWGLKPATKQIFGVQLGNFLEVVQNAGGHYFDDVRADQGEGLKYSAEDSDYALQHYIYWNELAQQIPTFEGCINKNYSEWLHMIEMPFTRVIGLMEYWGMAWNSEKAKKKHQEAIDAQENLANNIKQLGKELFDEEINPGKSGKTGDVQYLIFDLMKVAPAKWGKTRKDGTSRPSLDEEALIDMEFMLRNKLTDIEEEKYLSTPLPEGWEQIDVEKDPTLDKATRYAIRIARRPEHPYKQQAIDLIGWLKQIQKYSTLISSHIVGREKYLNDVSGRIHASYTPWTDTSRLNSSKPNGQNVPNPHNDELGIRNFYGPAPGKILFAIDFSGFELRLMAWKAKDANMIDIFRNNGDIHRRTASYIVKKPEEEVTKGERKDAKPANFGIAYGGTEHALQKTIKTDYGKRETLDECLLKVNAVKQAYPGIPEYQREIVLEAREYGYVSAIYGYKRMLHSINSANRYERGKDERRAGNTPIQGSAAEVMKRAQNEIYERLGQDTLKTRYDLEEVKAMIGPELAQLPAILVHGKTDMIAQIHDEILFEMDAEADLIQPAYDFIKERMEAPPIDGFPVPIIAEAEVATEGWGDKVDADEWLKDIKGA